jgi:hypothetical protein
MVLRSMPRRMALQHTATTLQVSASPSRHVLYPDTRQLPLEASSMRPKVRTAARASARARGASSKWRITDPAGWTPRSVADAPAAIAARSSVRVRARIATESDVGCSWPSSCRPEHRYPALAAARMGWWCEVPMAWQAIVRGLDAQLGEISIQCAMTWAAARRWVCCSSPIDSSNRCRQPSLLARSPS